MKFKKVLLTILLALVAIMLLQLQVKAEEIDYSEYDYLLTDEGVVTHLTSGAELIAGIKGEYTGTIEANLEDKELILTNFVAEGLDIVAEHEIHGFEINGGNSVDYIDVITNDEFDGFMLDIWGNGNLMFKGYMMVNEFYCDAMGICQGDINTTVFVGSYIEAMQDTNPEARNMIFFDFTLKPNYEKLVEYISYDVDEIIIWLSEPYPIPGQVFTELAKVPECYLTVLYRDDLHVAFKGSNIINPNASFTVGLSTSENPIEEMIDTKKDDVIYINFAHSGAVPGPIIIEIYNENFVEGDILKCYYYNETTKLYERVEDAKMISDYELQLNVDHCSSFVVSKTELPEEFVVGNNSEDKNESENNSGTGEEETKQESADDKKEEIKTEEDKKEENKKDTTTATGKIPHAGGTIAVVITMLAIIVVGTIAFIRNRKLKGI